jgi:MoaA/NifB/PqqE/SkfB family radical SAM enzyme
MARKLSIAQMAAGGVKFLNYLLRGGLFNINLEVTKRCNARCDFCDYWKEKPSPELEDYVPVVRKLNPLSVSLTGGEPLLRKDLAQIISSFRQNFRFLFISLITNGSLLTYQRGMELWEAGLDEFSISLDYLDERHDQGRRIPGLSRQILSVAPQLAASGVNLCFNVVMKRGNYMEIPRIVEYAAGINVKVSISTYNSWRTGNDCHVPDPSEMGGLKGVIEQLKYLGERYGNITSGSYYLDRIPLFFESRQIAGCTAGLNWLQVTADGMIKRCSDHPVSCDLDSWHRGFFDSSECGRCWYSCRGAAQEPMTFQRFTDMARDALEL